MIDAVLRRIMDIAGAVFGIWLTGPIMAAAALWVKLDSVGPIFYRQERIGLQGKPFKIFKFRTMVTNADRIGTLITVGDRDPRITTAGYWLRKFKIDELPQFINVLFAQMSFVGPRPEVRKYVDLYTPEQRSILEVRPGVTDIASIAYRNENEILEKKENPEEYYKSVIMQRKIKLNKLYLAQRNICSDLLVIFRTVFRLGR
ncbi:MAG: sugar transferase [Candidatus Riflebacteria bacterium]|nr:sugar transferase [Candidatus Riflebacteria bacterium]